MMTGARAAVLALVLMSLLELSSGYQSYQLKIPNGEMVPHPCKPNYLWRGVGHANPLGGGARNQFGIDFHNNGKKWNRTLCEKDSDGDGRTNGQELGDPQCVWNEGDAPSTSLGLSHPGVCDPWNSATCREKNTWVTCDTGEFKCPAIRQEGMQNITLRFAHTKVPPTETNYYCQTFQLPDDQDYHLVATQPLLNNSQVMHHMLLFGCNGERNSTDEAVSCDMGGNGCNDIIGGWTVGASGECLPESIGYLVGKSGYKSVVLQFHWNNPELRDDYYDSSAMMVYLTPSLRMNNAGVLMVGQTRLEIPPGATRHDEVASLPGSCTRMLAKQDFHVIIGTNHMHYLGRSMKVELFRDGQKVQDLTYDEVFSYDSPTTVSYDVPVLVKRGDEIRTTCTYTSTSRSTTTYYGDGTSQEMCFGFLSYYPMEAFDMRNAVCWKSVDICQMVYTKTFGNCNFGEFMSINNTVYTGYVGDVLSKCNRWGGCRHECRAAVRAFRQHPCFQGDVGDYVMMLMSWDDKYGLPFLQSAQTCPEEFRDPTLPTPPPPGPGPTGAAASPPGALLAPLLALLALAAL